MDKNRKIKRETDKCSCRNTRAVRFLIPALLLLISENPSHGYELMDQYQAFRFTEAGSDPGAIYRTLKMLESEGYIKSKWETEDPGPAKKIYSVTDKGRLLLSDWANSIEERIHVFGLFLKRYKKMKA